MYVCGGKIACLLACLPDGGLGGRKIILVGDVARDTTQIQIQMQRVASRAINSGTNQHLLSFCLFSATTYLSGVSLLGKITKHNNPKKAR